MEKALQNPDYKKIWEKVMMNRHPEVKNLEEALKMEAYQDGCLFYNTEKNMYGLNIADNILTRYTPLRTDYGFCRHKNTEFTYQDEPYDWQYGYNFEILGRPITLEDIWLKYPNFRNYSLKNNGCFVDIYEAMGAREEFTRFFWQITKPLHEQTPQTWRSIYIIITTNSYLYRNLV